MRLSCAKFLDRRAACNRSIWSEAFELRRKARILRSAFQDAGVAEWQTRWTQNPVIARSCGFKSLRRQIACVRSCFTNAAKVVFLEHENAHSCRRDRVRFILPNAES